LELGDSYTYTEALYLTGILVRDTTSWVASAMQGWSYPVSREWIVMQDHYNMTLGVNTKKKQKPYPTPWEQSKGKTVGNTGERSQEEIIARLEKMNPKDTNAS
tara:strand:- start:2384 stop:2692 length:309 start_codon:yes stop_codon:yes gene_type:complete